MRKTADHFIGGRREQLAAIFGIQFGLHADKRNGLIAVIRDYKKDRHVAILAVVDIEDRGFVLDVIRIDCDCNFFRGVVVMRRIGTSRLRGGHDKLFSRKRTKAAEQRKAADCQKTQGSQPRRAR